MVGGNHDEPHLALRDRPPHRLDKWEFSPLHVHVEHLDRPTAHPREYGVHVEGLVARKIGQRRRRAAHERLDERCRAAIERKIPAAHLQVGGRGLDAESR